MANRFTHKQGSKAVANNTPTPVAKVPLPAFLRVQGEGAYLTVKLQPRSSKNEIGEPLGDALRIKVTAPPVDSAANEALVHLLADQLHCARGAVQLVRGQTSRHKILLISGLAPEVVWERLFKHA